MGRLLKSLILSLLLLLVFSKETFAIVDPLAAPNNKFGIHITNESDLESAAELVNSSGGDWGYVTVVIREDEMDIGRWQTVFNKMREMHLIPIVRIATSFTDDGWAVPQHEKIEQWVLFFDSLNWVIHNRYVVIGNEPNHASEWDGTLDPEAYADYLKDFSKTLKDSNSDYFVLPAGFDASAPNSASTMSESEYLERMHDYDPEIFNYIDGWTSHSYPNPAFSGSEYDIGRGSIRTFEWELEYLRSLGVVKDMPVFITETGWVHDKGEQVLGVTSTQDLGQKYKNAFDIVWDDERIVAVTPFLISYSDPPFDTFSWKRPDGSFYDFYYKLKELTKIKGEPVQINKLNINKYTANIHAKANDKAQGYLFIQNVGQSILTPGSFDMEILGSGNVNIIGMTDNHIVPGESGFILFESNTKSVGQVEKQMKMIVNNVLISDDIRIRLNTYETENIWVQVYKAKLRLEQFFLTGRRSMFILKNEA